MLKQTKEQYDYDIHILSAKREMEITVKTNNMFGAVVHNSPFLTNLENEIICSIKGHKNCSLLMKEQFEDKISILSRGLLFNFPLYALLSSTNFGGWLYTKHKNNPTPKEILSYKILDLREIISYSIDEVFFI